MRPAKGEALRRLIEKWRDESRSDVDDDQQDIGYNMAKGEDASELEAALAPLSGPVEPQIEHFWTALERGWDIEPRSYFEREALAMGFKSPVEMAVHYMWKRHAKDWPATKAEAFITALDKRSR